jgi:hypothetical protein
MQLYRGLTQRFKAERLPEPPVPGAMRDGTDFTDCPFTALEYARGGRGVVLVLDLPEPVSPAKVSEELWSNPRARRLMVWGRFDNLVVAQIPAKELRAQVRRRGIVTMSDQYKSQLLADYIKRMIAGGTTGRQPDGRMADGTAAQPSDLALRRRPT